MRGVENARAINRLSPNKEALLILGFRCAPSGRVPLSNVIQGRRPDKSGLALAILFRRFAAR